MTKLKNNLCVLTINTYKIDYSLDATDNPVKLAYADLKTNSQLSNVADVTE